MKIRFGKQDLPDRILIYGVDGIGKTTFASEAPSTVFLTAESGIKHLEVASFEGIHTWTDSINAIKYLAENETPTETLAIDSLDWLEDKLAAQICKEHGIRSLSELGWGKGQKELRTRFLDLFFYLDKVVAKGIQVILIAHSLVSRFNDPEREPYDRYTVKLDPENADKVREWCDYVIFCNFDTNLKEEGNVKRARSTNTRTMYTQRTAAFDAKQRVRMPVRIPMKDGASYASFDAARKANTTASEDKS